MTMKQVSDLISPRFGIRFEYKPIMKCEKCGTWKQQVYVVDRDGNTITSFIKLCDCEEEKKQRMDEINMTMDLERRSSEMLLKRCGIDDVNDIISTSVKTHKGNIKAWEALDKFVENFDKRRTGG